MRHASQANAIDGQARGPGLRPNGGAGGDRGVSGGGPVGDVHAAVVEPVAAVEHVHRDSGGLVRIPGRCRAHNGEQRDPGASPRGGGIDVHGDEVRGSRQDAATEQGRASGSTLPPLRMMPTRLRTRSGCVGQFGRRFHAAAGRATVGAAVRRRRARKLAARSMAKFGARRGRRASRRETVAGTRVRRFACSRRLSSASAGSFSSSTRSLRPATPAEQGRRRRPGTILAGRVRRIRRTAQRRGPPAGDHVGIGIGKNCGRAGVATKTAAQAAGNGDAGAGTAAVAADRLSLAGSALGTTTWRTLATSPAPAPRHGCREQAARRAVGVVCCRRCGFRHQQVRTSARAPGQAHPARPATGQPALRSAAASRTARNRAGFRVSLGMAGLVAGGARVHFPLSVKDIDQCPGPEAAALIHTVQGGTP